MNTRMGQTAICATDITDMFMLFEVRDHQVPSDFSRHVSVEVACLLTPSRRAFAHRGGANTEIKPDRSKVKRLSSGLSRGLSMTSVNRHYLTINHVL